MCIDMLSWLKQVEVKYYSMPNRGLYVPKQAILWPSEPAGSLVRPEKCENEKRFNDV